MVCAVNLSYSKGDESYALGGLSSRATSRSSTVVSSRTTTQSSSRPTSKPWK